MTRERLGALDLVNRVVDPGTFRPWDERPIVPASALVAMTTDYLANLAAAQEQSGVDEAVVTGEARLGGRRIATVMCEFGFLAGSIGMAAAERLVRAVERATAERLPLFAGPASGGTRMQEGTVAFLQMVKISAAVAAHKQSGLPYVVYLRHPTMGGVFASWGSLGHITAAEPGAMIGFLGPRVYRALYGQDFPTGVQTAENLAARGLVDAVVSPEQLRQVAIRALEVLAPREESPIELEPPHEEVPDVPAWESIERSRRPDRPGVKSLLRVAANTVTPLQGTGEGERDPGISLALARFGSAPCVVLGQNRRRTEQPMGPAGLREGRRAMRLAEDLHLPLVTVIDTAGAALSREAEERGLASEIARSLTDLIRLRAPTLCLLLGEGAGGGALALLPADRVLCAQHAWLSPLPPEGASVIRYRDVDHAPYLADLQGVRSLDLLRHGIVDRIVPERPDAAEEPKDFLDRLGKVLEYELGSLRPRTADDLVASRLARYRHLGM